MNDRPTGWCADISLSLRLSDGRRRGMLLHDERGAVAVVIAVSLLALVSLAALVVDLGFALASRQHLQNLADAAALAGAGQLGRLYENPAGAAPAAPSPADRARVRAVVSEVAATNRAATKLTGVTVADLRLGRWNPATRTVVSASADPDAVLVRAQGFMPTFLAGVVGIRQLSLSATASAALTAMAEATPGALALPAGISSAWMAQGPIEGRRLRLYAPNGGDPCAGWSTFTDAPPTIGRLQSIVQGLTRRAYTSPSALVDRTRFQFVVGNPAAIAPDLMALYNARKNPATGQWTTTIAVYRQAQCAVPAGAVALAGFATAVITAVPTPDGPALDAVMRTGFIQRGRGGGPDYGTNGSIPALVQ